MISVTLRIENRDHHVEVQSLPRVGDIFILYGERFVVMSIVHSIDRASGRHGIKLILAIQV